jgi:septum formation protein
MASASKIRSQLLKQAGVAHTVTPADLDESEIKQSWQGQGTTTKELAEKLAQEKALFVAKLNPKALVIGSDQILDCEGTRYDKPKDLDQAGDHLHRLQGRSHTLVTAVCLAQGNRISWTHTSSPTLTMRPLNDEFIANYLRRNQPDILSCVGVYQLEGEGAQLFDHIEGDYFSILGLPLLPLLAMLRQQGVLNT